MEYLEKIFSYLLRFHKFCEKTVFLHKFLISTLLQLDASLFQSQSAGHKTDYKVNKIACIVVTM